MHKPIVHIFEIFIFPDNPKNPKGLWPEAKTMYANDTLADFCSRIHFLNGKTSYEVIDEAHVEDGTLRFIGLNGTYEPMQITVVNFTSSREGIDYYVTKGMRDDCLLYLDPVNKAKSEYHLTQHLCDCVFF